MPTPLCVFVCMVRCMGVAGLQSFYNMRRSIFFCFGGEESLIARDENGRCYCHSSNELKPLSRPSSRGRCGAIRREFDARRERDCGVFNVLCREFFHYGVPPTCSYFDPAFTSPSPMRRTRRRRRRRRREVKQHVSVVRLDGVGKAANILSESPPASFGDAACV